MKILFWLNKDKEDEEIKKKLKNQEELTAKLDRRLRLIESEYNTFKIRQIRIPRSDD